MMLVALSNEVKESAFVNSQDVLFGFILAAVAAFLPVDIFKHVLAVTPEMM
jgi:hypothetical protein